MSTLTYLKARGQRFLLSPCGQTGIWMDRAECAAHIGWLDCTDMNDEEFQQVIAERLANRPHIASLAAHRQARLTLAAFDQMEHQQRRGQAESRSEVERAARNRL